MMGTVGLVRGLSDLDSDRLVGPITFDSSTLKLCWPESESDSLSLYVSSRRFDSLFNLVLRDFRD